MTRLQGLIAPATKLLRLALSSHPKRKESSSYPLHRAEPFHPFFIVGSGRCGSTLLRRILMAHDDIYIPPETYELGPSVLAFRRHSDLPWPIICRLVLSYFILGEGFESFPKRVLRPCFIRLRDTPDTERSLAVIINELYCYLGENAAPSFKIWGDKTPINAFYLNEIDAVFPRARYIHMIRDGCDVIYSYLAMARYSDIEKAADRWTRSVTLCHEFGRTREDRFIEIFYEDLVMKPEETIAKICEFIGISFDSQMLDKMPDKPLGDVETKSHHSNVMRTINEASIGKGRAGLTMEHRQILHERISNHLKTLGYPPVIG